MSTNYVPAVTVSDVTLGAVVVGTTLPELGAIQRPYLVANVSKVTASGIRYTVGYDSSGQRVISGTNAPGYISLSGMQSALSYSTWNTPSGIGHITASFVYASGIQQSIGIDTIKALTAVPSASIGHQLAYIVSNILGLSSPGASYTSTFSNISTLASAFNTNIAQQLVTALELQSSQEALLKAIIMANGPLITTTASGTYTLLLDGNMTDIIVSSDIRNVACARTAYGKVNYLTIPSSIPILLRFTSLVPDVLFDVDTVPIFTAGQQLTTTTIWQNTGRAGSAFNATPSGTTGVFMRIDPEDGRRYLETKGTNQGFLAIPGSLPFAYATDSPIPGFTVAYVFRFPSSSSDGVFLKMVNTPITAQFTHNASASNHTVESSSNYLTVNAINAGVNTHINFGKWVIHVVSFRHNLVPLVSWLFNKTMYFKAYTLGSASVPLTSGVASFGPGQLYNINADIRAFHMYRYGMSQGQIDNLVYMLQQQYNV